MQSQRINNDVKVNVGGKIQDHPNVELPEAIDTAKSNKREIDHRWLTFDLTSLNEFSRKL
jgi:hypothetical protein